MMNARPVRAMIAHVVSPTSEPNWTNSAGINPRAAPRRMVSAVTTPGGAQKAIARTNDEIKRDIVFRRQTEVFLSLSLLLHFRHREEGARSVPATLHSTAFGAVRMSNPFTMGDCFVATNAPRNTCTWCQCRCDIYQLTVKIHGKFMRGWA